MPFPYITTTGTILIGKAIYDAITEGSGSSYSSKILGKNAYKIRQEQKDFLTTGYYDLDDILNQVNEAVTDRSHNSSENFYGTQYSKTA